MRLRGNPRKRLAAVRQEVARLRDAVAVLDQQIAHAAEIAEEAQTRAVVTSSSVTDREHRHAADDLRRIRREREEKAQRIARLLAEQDSLLEQL